MVKNKLLKKSKDRYYTNSDRLGELLMDFMLQEVHKFCKIDIQQDWAAHAHQQVMTLKQITKRKNNFCDFIKYSHLPCSIHCMIQLLSHVDALVNKC